MASIWEKTKAVTSAAAAATGRAAKRTRLNTEIMALGRDVRKAQSAFGVKSYDLVLGGDLSGAQRVAGEYRANIEKWRAMIDAKKAEIERLNDEARQAGEKIPPPPRSPVAEDDDGNVVI